MDEPEIVNPFLNGESTLRSFNRAQIIDLPGIRVDDGVLGGNGYQLLSAATLRRQIVARADLLRIDPAAGGPIRQLDRSFTDGRRRPHASGLARDYGRRLGYLLLMLARGDEANRSARAEWSDEHWEFWKTIRRVCVGGGLMAGELGRIAVEAAQELLDGDGANLRVERSPYAGYLTLVGLARSAPPSAARMLVLDFGQTSVKRGVATYSRMALSSLLLLPDAKSPCEDALNLELSVEATRARWERMLGVIEESWGMVGEGGRDGTALGISVSCYLFDGHPSPRERGCYASLQLLTDHLESFVKREVDARLGLDVPLVLMHDGTAAAASYAGSPHTLVLTLGTAIGNGFPPMQSGRPLRPSFEILS